MTKIIDDETLDRIIQIQDAMKRASVSIPDYNSDILENYPDRLDLADREILKHDGSLSMRDLDMYKKYMACHHKQRGYRQ